MIYYPVRLQIKLYSFYLYIPCYYLHMMFTIIVKNKFQQSIMLRFTHFWIINFINEPNDFSETYLNSIFYLLKY